MMIVFIVGLLSFGTPQVEVVQGSIGRWVGACDACGMDGKVYQPVGDACYYPVDMGRKPGTIEIARWVNGVMEKGWLVIKAVDFPTQEIEFPDDRYVNLSQEDLEKHYQDQVAIKPLFRLSSGSPQFTLPLKKPAEPLPEGQFFGVNRKFNGEGKNQHTGSDYAIGLGNPVLAPADGKVVLTGEHFFAGQSVYVYHGGGLVTMYFHLGEISVSKGDPVNQGDPLAKTGSTGRSTGPHLHVGARWLGARIDPNLLFESPDELPTVQ